MSRYDGLIIPRSYSEYINKTDAATLQQALQLSGILSNAVAAGDNKAIKSAAVHTALANYINTKQIRIDDSSGYTLYHGVYVKTISNFFSTNGIDYRNVINIRQINNGNDIYPYFFISQGNVDVLKVFKFASVDNTYVDIKVYYF